MEQPLEADGGAAGIDRFPASIAAPEQSDDPFTHGASMDGSRTQAELIKFAEFISLSDGTIEP